jgi:hypothetical protein
MSHRQFTRTFFIATLLMFFTAVLTNVVIDPFAIFDTPSLVGWNEMKPAAWGRPDIHKTFAVRALTPDALIFGTSRAEVGINPRHSAFVGLKPYNLAVSGANMAQIAKYYDHARIVAPPRLLVVGLDFHAFNVYNNGRNDIDEMMFARETAWEPVLLPLRKAKVAIGWQTLLNSMNTLDVQRQVKAHRWTKDGRGQVNPASVEANIIELGSQRNLFTAVEKRDVHDEYLTGPRHEFALGLDRHDSPMESLRRIVREAYLNNMDVRFFISPVHARRLEVIRGLNLWGAFEDWKRTLVTMMEAEAKVAGSHSFPLWDFSGYNDITTETVPADDDSKTRMRWYWESSHYRTETGDMILNRMFQIAPSEPAQSNDFGVLLNRATLEAHLSGIRLARQRYAQQRPQEVAEVMDLLRNEVQNRNFPADHAAQETLATK